MDIRVLGTRVLGTSGVPGGKLKLIEISIDVCQEIGAFVYTRCRVMFSNVQFFSWWLICVLGQAA